MTSYDKCDLSVILREHPYTTRDNFLTGKQTRDTIGRTNVHTKLKLLTDIALIAIPAFVSCFSFMFRRPNCEKPNCAAWPFDF